MMLKNKKILLGIPGGIAIYRTLDLIDLLKEEGASVKVILTSNAKKFVTPLTFKSVIGSNNTVFSDEEFFTNALQHIELARWADLFVIIPASANTIAKMANGISDNLLLSTYVAYDGKTAIVPAMNPIMWQQKSIRNSIAFLKQNGVALWGPQQGKVTCGDYGFGKMLNINDITAHITKELFPQALLNKKVVITAAATVEELDEVRFFSNYSSGKMGYALAQIASFLGANVTLVSGPSYLNPPLFCNFIAVKSAKEMEIATTTNAHNADFLIMAAAVTDFTSLSKFSGKVTKEELINKFCLTLNNDILLKLTSSLTPKPFCVGFALESDNLIHKAKAKLLKKGADVIVANLMGENTGFTSDTNEVYVVSKKNITNIPLMPKNKLAVAIWAELLDLYLHKNN